MAAQKPHMFDQCAWRLIKEFIGIYGIKMNYTKIKNLSRAKLSKACEIVEHLSYFGDCSMLVKQWKRTILKKVAEGYKNRQFYEELAKMVAPPPKVTCICGLKIGSKIGQQYNHFRTRNHVNRMLKCVPVSKVVDSKVPVWEQMGNSHTLIVRKWSNQQRQFLLKQIDLRPYMEQRERFNGTTHYTIDEILVGGWTIGW